MPLARPYEPQERDQYPAPSARIIIHHPGYADGYDTLIRLDGFDKKDTSSSLGLHMGTALVICGIITSHFSGYFTRVKEKEAQQIQFEDDAVLEGGDYYLHIPGDETYAVCPAFEHWKFPHDNPLSPWACSAISHSSTGIQPNKSYAHQSSTFTRDQGCLVSRYRDMKEACHVCPAEELVWFRQNNMTNYILDTDVLANALLEDVANLVALRRDIHKSFDDREWAFAGKEGVWSVHFLKPTNDLGPTYHNLRVPDLQGKVSGQLLLTRLAWAVLPRMREFWSGPSKRWVTVRTVNESDGTTGWIKKYLNQQETERMMRKKSRSPAKRKAPDGDGQDAVEEEGADCGGSESSEDSNWHWPSSSEEDDSPRRGRKRKRSSASSAYQSVSLPPCKQITTCSDLPSYHNTHPTPDVEHVVLDDQTFAPWSTSERA
ncbi:uncharacterized protein KY384_008023 [Bacidia gigantensis]|uniref:uncharacterized protein n=1 Tax=Bacidia gigantensis TaxID=2732470 RepID=UPI001D0544B1|nr:uncharacterized protein KY384_008023 [Bacidia gigantensis]KAG8527279.1 hypothetical protein KY384_008023 [Bacidia gigantensis]